MGDHYADLREEARRKKELASSTTSEPAVKPPKSKEPLKVQLEKGLDRFLDLAEEIQDLMGENRPEHEYALGVCSTVTWKAYLYDEGPSDFKIEPHLIHLHTGRAQEKIKHLKEGKPWETFRMRKEAARSSIPKNAQVKLDDTTDEKKMVKFVEDVKQSSGTELGPADELLELLWERFHEFAADILIHQKPPTDEQKRTIRLIRSLLNLYPELRE